MHSLTQESGRLRVHLLGTFRIERNQFPIQLPTRKIENLFAYLILHPEVHSREKLAALFWGDSPQEDARASLRQSLSILRRKIDKNLFLTERGSIQIATSFPIWVDVLNFEKLAQQFLAAPERTGEPFDHTLYPGDLLPEVYDNWIFSLREHYRTLFIKVMLRSVELLRARSEYARAIEYVQQILETDTANERAHQHLMFCYVTRGERDKALQQYAACQRALKDELDVEPSEETQALYHWIKETVTNISSRAAKITNLPIPISSFVGRHQELTEIKQWLSTMRLMTLTGVGGSGKTRLAIHTATDLIDAYRDGVWWVELAPLTEASLVPYAVARALGMEVDSEQPVIDAIISFLQNRQVLLVLDNCEHLISASAELADALLRNCEGLKILATSREALRVMGEQVWLAPTLSKPETAEISLVDMVMRYEAVQLFVERTQAVRPDFELTERDALAVAQICQRLDGIPLAIELAAARMKMMSAPQIADRLDDQFRLLTGGARTAEDRHRTLRAAVDWSYDLLSGQEQQLFNRLSIFAGGWTIGSAEAVCSGKAIQAEEILHLLGLLVDKSLINLDESGERYTMLETMKAYGREKLSERGEDSNVQQRYLDYFLALAETADQKIRGPEQLPWLERLKMEHDNLNSAMEQSLNHPTTIETGIQLVCALAKFWNIIGDINTCRYWLQKGLIPSETLGRTAVRAKFLLTIGFWSSFTVFAVRIPEQQKLLAKSIDIWEALGPDYLVEKAKCLLSLAWIRNRYYNDNRGFELFNECMKIFREQNETWWQARALEIWVTMCAGESLEKIRDGLLEATPLWYQLGDQYGIGTILMEWGLLSLQQGDYLDAEKYFLDSLALMEKLGAKGYLFLLLRNLGSVKRGLKQYEEAIWYYRQTLPEIQKTGLGYKYTIVYLGLGFIALYKNELTQAADFFAQAVQISKEYWVTERILFCIGGFAAIEVLRENLYLAARLFGAYSALFEAYSAQPERNVFRCPVTLIDIEHFLSLCRNQLDGESFEQAWNAGQTLTLDEAVEEVLGTFQQKH